MNQNKGGIMSTFEKISIAINIILAALAVLTYFKNQELKVSIIDYEETIQTKEAELESTYKYYSSSLGVYAQIYRDLLSRGATELESYNHFVKVGQSDFIGQPNRFRDEKDRRFNVLKGKMSAIVDHVNRFRGLLEPFSKSLNGRVERLNDGLSSENERLILRTFESLNEGATSQITALEEEIKRLETK